MSIYILGARRDVDFSNLNSDMIPSTPNTFDIGGVGSEWRNARIGLDLVVDGNLTVNGTTTTVNSSTLTVDDKNIELAATVSPTDALADGGGIIIKGDTDKTWLWNLASGAMESNQPIRTGNLELNGNSLLSTNLDGNILLSPNGIGKVEIAGQIKITGGNPGIGKVITGTDALGNADWQVSSGGGWVDDGIVVRLATITDTVGIGTITPQAPLQVSGPGGVSVGGFPSGALHVTSDSSAQFSNAAISGHSLFGGNTQLWHLGSVSGSNDDVLLFNRQPGNLFLGTNNTTFFTMNSVGSITVGPLTATQLTADNLRLDGNVFSSIDTNGIIIIAPDGTGTLLLTTDKVLMLGSSIAATGDNSGLVEIRDNRTTTGANPNYVLSINQQNGTLSVLSMGNDGNANAILVTHNNDLRIGNDVAGTFTENMRIESGGNVNVSGSLTAPQLTVDNIDINGNTISATNLNGDLILDAFVAGTGVVIVIDQLEIQGSTSQLLLTDSDTGKTYIVKNNLSDYSIVEIGGNNSFKIKSGAASNSLEINPTEVTIGTKLIVGNLNLDGNTISSTDLNGNINLSPNGTGDVVIANQLKISGGIPGLNKVLTSDANGLATWETSVGTAVIQETFASTNVRYFGELGLPGSQTGWTETGTGVISVEVDDNVFGVIKNTVKHFSTTGNSTKSESPVTAADWVNILTFGASFSAITRITEAIGNSMFAGVGFSAVNDPRVSSIESRTGMFISVNATHTTIQLDGQAVVVLDGTGGNPLVLKDEWFTWEAVINPTPDAGVSFGAVDVYVNNVLIITGAIVSSNNAVSDEISLANSSSSGQTTFYADNFGITIYEEAATKTLTAATMAGDVAQINIPEGKRDYTIILPDGNPRPIGSVLRLVATNLFGIISLENQNPAVPEVLYNGLRTLVINIAVKETIEGINTVSSGNVYLGFQTSDIDRTKTIFVQLSSSVTQDPVDTNPTVITFNTQDAINGITHSTTVNPGEITIDTKGVYFISPQSQVGKTSGATKTDFDIFIQVDRGSGFVDQPNSNIKLTIKDSDITDVALKAIGISLNVGDKIRLMQRVSNAGVGMGLKATAAETGPPTIPATAAINLDMHRIGGLAV